MKALFRVTSRPAFDRLARLAICGLLGGTLAGAAGAAEPPTPPAPGPDTVQAPPAAPTPNTRVRPRRGLEDFVLESDAMQMIVRPSIQEIEVKFLGRDLLRYSMAPTNYKPYVKEFRTLRGDNLLLDAPPDHPHHHGLMYAVTVNGTNFWEEQVNPGVQRAAPLPMRYVGKSPTGLPQAVFAHQTAWLANAHRTTTNAYAVALLLETRTLTLTADVNAGEVALQWRSEFTVGRGAESVTLSGTPYHGLGLRFVRDFDLKARHLNSENTLYPARQTGEVIPARWAATLGQVDGREALVAIFAAPGNAGTSRFFSMLEPFAYLSATQGLDQTPLTYRRGDRFRLDYLVVVRTDHPGPDALEARYRKWVEELAHPPGR